MRGHRCRALKLIPNIIHFSIRTKAGSLDILIIYGWYGPVQVQRVYHASHVLLHCSFFWEIMKCVDWWWPDCRFYFQNGNTKLAFHRVGRLSKDLWQWLPTGCERVWAETIIFFLLILFHSSLKRTTPYTKNINLQQY